MKPNGFLNNYGQLASEIKDPVIFLRRKIKMYQQNLGKFFMSAEKRAVKGCKKRKRDSDDFCLGVFMYITVQSILIRAYKCQVEHPTNTTAPKRS